MTDYKLILDLIDFDELYDADRVITNHNSLTKDKTFSEDGLFSEKLFGKRADNENLSYQCECGKYKGRFLEGYLCEHCDTTVKYTEELLDRLAWINFGKYHLINPVLYFQLQTLAGTKNFKKMLKYNVTIDTDGNPIIDEDNPYENMGLVRFKEEFDDILEIIYKKSRHKDKDKLYNLIKKNRDLVFINSIPVYSTILRPANITFQDKPIFNFDEINKSYSYLIKLSNMINDENLKDFDLSVLPHLYTMQVKLNMIFEKIIDNISGKEGFIRSKTMANRINFSARNVITPLPPGYGIDSISLPYLTFIELYGFHIINILSKVKNISENEANHILEIAKTKFNPEIYNIGMELIKKTKGGCKILLNRNPSIAYGSFLCLNVVDIKKDYTDLTASINNLILASLAGDYDGDVLNIIALMDNKFKSIFTDIFSPINMFISKDNGKFNNNLNIERDLVLGMHVFNLHE